MFPPTFQPLTTRTLCNCRHIYISLLPNTLSASLGALLYVVQSSADFSSSQDDLHPVDMLEHKAAIWGQEKLVLILRDYDNYSRLLGILTASLTLVTYVGLKLSPSLRGGRSVTRATWDWVRLADFTWLLGRTDGFSVPPVEFDIGLQVSNSSIDNNTEQYNLSKMYHRSKFMKHFDKFMCDY